MSETHTVTITLPEAIEQQLRTEWGAQGFPRRVLEAIALEGYRSEALSAGQVAELLDLSLHETETFLKERGAYLHYSIDDLEQDRLTHERLFPQ
jgi:predicted HTH domain antitoxin